MSWFFSDFQWYFSNGVVKNELYESRPKIRWKVLLFETDAFFILLGHSKKNSRPIFEFFSMQLSKLHSTCLDEHFERKNIFIETKFLSSFSDIDIERNVFNFLSEHFWLPCQNCILCVQLKFLAIFKKIPKREKVLPMLAFSLEAIGKFRVLKNVASGPFRQFLLAQHIKRRKFFKFCQKASFNLTFCNSNVQIKCNVSWRFDILWISKLFGSKL